MIWVDSQGENSIAFTPGSNAAFSVDDLSINRQYFKSGMILLTTFESPMDIIFKAIITAKQSGMFVVVDPAPAPVEKIPDEVLKCIDIIKPNETEAEIIAGKKIDNEEDRVGFLNFLKEQSTFLVLSFF